MNLERAHEIEDGIICNDAVLFDSIFGKVVSEKPTYSGAEISQIEYYNSHTQIDANRVAKAVFTYDGMNLTQEVITFYKTDGVTAYKTYTLNHTYSGADLTKSEGTEV